MTKSILILLTAIISIQFGASQAKLLFQHLGVAGTSTLRLFFASLMMSAIFRPWKYKFSSSVILYGLSLGLMNFSFYFALKRIPLGIAVALEFTGPLAVAIFTSKKKIDYLWAVMAAIGILCLIPTEASSEATDLTGIFLALLAGFFWALYIIFGKKAGSELKGGAAASMGMLIAALVVLPPGLFIDGEKMFQWSYLPLALIVSFFGSAFPYTLEMFALKKIPAQTFGVLMSLEPVIAAIVGFFILGEALSFRQWMAVICVISSSLGSSLTNRS